MDVAARNRIWSFLKAEPVMAAANMEGGRIGMEFLKILFCSKSRRALCNDRIHRHRGWSLFYLISGKAHVVVLSDNKEKAIDINPGEFVFLASRVPHRLRIADDHTYIVHLMLYPCGEEEAALALKQLKAASEEAFRMICKPALFVRASDLNNMLINTLTEVLLNFDFCRKEEGLSAVPGLMLQTMLIEIAYLCKQNMEPRVDRHVNQAIAYLKRHSTEVVRVADVADEAGVHPAYLQRIFKERMKMSMMEYLVQYRVGRARQLLLNTSFPIIDIALECGFANRQHFSRCFRQQEGITPSEFRMRNKICSDDTIYVRTEKDKPDDIIEL